MNAISTIALTLAYLVPVALIALLLTAQRRRHDSWLILIVLTALPVFYVGHYFLLQQMQGWPSNAPLPPQFRLLGFTVTEPDPGIGKKGQILLWVKGADNDQARAHRVTYHKDLHQELVATGQRQAGGKHQIGTRGRQPSTGPANDSKEIIHFEDAKGRSLPLKQ